MPISPPPRPQSRSPLSRRWGAVASTAKTWITRAHAAPDRGSSTLETIVIAALIFAAALGAVGAIIAAINRFQGTLG